MGLASRALHGRLQPRPLLVPAGVFGLQFLIDGLAFGLDRGGPAGVPALARVGRSQSLVDGLSPALALPLRGSLRLGAVPLASRFSSRSYAAAAFRSAAESTARPTLFAGVRAGALRVPPDRLSPRPSSVGRPGCSLNGAFDPTGLFRTTPGLTKVAAITSGSSLCFAAP